MKNEELLYLFLVAFKMSTLHRNFSDWTILSR